MKTILLLGSSCNCSSTTNSSPPVARISIDLRTRGASLCRPFQCRRYASHFTDDWQALSIHNGLKCTNNDDRNNYGIEPGTSVECGVKRPLARGVGDCLDRLVSIDGGMVT